VLAEVKQALRISHSALDTDIQGLIEEARQDLILAGISSEKAQSVEDILIKRAIKTYAKSQFIVDLDQAKRYQHSYDLLKQHLSMSGEYL
jgi:uncharacterized phage protein (predicted DNA packaging)